MKKYYGYFLAFVFCMPLLAQKSGNKKDNGYTISEPDKQYGIFHAVKSDSNHKEFPVLVFLPDNYHDSRKEYPVVYMLHGVNRQPLTEEGIRSMNNPSTKIKEAATFYQVIIVCPLVGNTFYMNAPKKPEQKIASFVGIELPAFIDKNYRTIKSREGRFLAGFSMGGYGAVSLLCRFPDTFSGAISRAGVLDLATGIHDLDWDNAPHTIDILGSYWDNQELYHLNSCPNLINRIRDRKDVFIILEVGTEDFLYKCNVRLHQKLNETGIPHIFAEYPGGHEWTKNCLFSMLSHLQFFAPTVYKN